MLSADARMAAVAETGPAHVNRSRQNFLQHFARTKVIYFEIRLLLSFRTRTCSDNREEVSRRVFSTFPQLPLNLIETLLTYEGIEYTARWLLQIGGSSLPNSLQALTRSRLAIASASVP